MLNGRAVCVVMPAYNAETTLERTYREIPSEIVDSVILVDDGSSDRTVQVAKAGAAPRRPPEEPGLRRQPEDLLRPGPGIRRGHRDHAPSGLPGYRAYSRRVLESVRFQDDADGFVFDNQFFMQMIAARFRIGEISCPTLYFPEASSIGFRSSVRYGLGCLREALRCFLHRTNIARSALLTSRDA